MRTKDKMNIRRVVQEFYGNSGPELEYINLSIEKKYIYIYIYFTIKIYIRNFYVCCLCDCGLHSTTLYPRFIYEINHKSP